VDQVNPLGLIEKYNIEKVLKANLSEFAGDGVVVAPTGGSTRMISSIIKEVKEHKKNMLL